MVHQRLFKVAVVLTGAAMAAGSFGLLRSGADAVPGPTITPPASGPDLAGVCGNTAELAGPSSAPAGSVTVPAGASIQNAVNANPTGTTFYLPGARYDLTGPVTPKTGDTFIGGPATVIDGGMVATSAFKAGVNFSTTPWGMADDVTLRSLTVQHVNAPDDQVVVNADAGDGWTLDRMTVQDNHGGAVMMGARNTIINSCLTRNGQYGFNTYRCRGYRNGGCATATVVTDLVIDHTEISYNDTERLAITRPGCGCSGGGKFWDVRGARITDNWVHHNNSVGLWADTNDADFLFQNNVIEDNDAAGIMYEISYNARIIGNTLRRNAIGQGVRRLAASPGDHFPDGAIYISESGGDAAAVAAARAQGESWTQVNADQNTLEISDNVFEDNWNGVILWESSDRYCSSSANTSTGYCTLYHRSFVPGGSNKTACTGTLTGAALDDCRWKTQNVNVHHNRFAIDRAAVGNGCSETDNHCGRNAIFSQWGSFANYPGERVQRSILFNQANQFIANVYVGTWRFTAFDQAQSSIRASSVWTAPRPANALTSYSLWTTPAQGIGQDALSSFGGVAPQPPTSSTSTPATTTPATTTPATTTPATTTPATTTPATTTPATTTPVTTTPVTTTPVTTTPATTTPATTTPATTVPGTTRTLGFSTKLEAEAATWSGLKQVNWGKGWTGTGWLTGWDNPGYVDWAVTVPTAGTYAIGVRYVSPFMAANLDFSVNGTTVATKVPFAKTAIAKGDWTQWSPAQTVARTVTLKAGVNHVRLVRPVGSPAGVSIDSLQVTGV